MRKIYMLAASLFIGATAFSQTQTLTVTNHFEGALQTEPLSISIYSWQDSTGNSLGYVSGTNAYGDLGVVQLFDASYGVTDEGVINKVGVYIPAKFDGGGNITVGVWENNGGNVGALLASEVVSIANIDTTTAGLEVIMNAAGTGLLGAYNVEVTFATAPAIPSNKSFFAGILLPDFGSGDVIGVLTTNQDFNFAHAETHAGVINSDGDFDGYGNYGLPISNAIFPTITLGQPSGLAKNEMVASKLYPNPVANNFTIEYSSNNVSNVNIMNLNGQVISTHLVSNGQIQIDGSNLEAGIYLYQSLDNNGNVLQVNKFVKN